MSGGDKFYEDLNRKSYSLGQSKDFKNMLLSRQSYEGTKTGLSFGVGLGGTTGLCNNLSNEVKFEVSTNEFKDLNFKD